MEQPPQEPVPQEPVPSPDDDPIGYIDYVVEDMRALVEHASPSKEALTRRLDCIKAALPVPQTFADARRTMAAALRGDEGLRIAYEANVAMLLHDNFDRADFKDPDVRDDAARQILHKVFEA